CTCPSVLFFFSSRRRHTRSKRDWSSDVCSSDLGGEEPPERHRHPIADPHGAGIDIGQLALEPAAALEVDDRGHDGWRERVREPRSEERRVGKECRSRAVQDEKEEDAHCQAYERE